MKICGFNFDTDAVSWNWRNAFSNLPDKKYQPNCDDNFLMWKIYEKYIAILSEEDTHMNFEKRNCKYLRT